MEFYAYAETKTGLSDLGYHRSKQLARRACYRHARAAKVNTNRLRTNWRLAESSPDVYKAQTPEGITFVYGEVDRGQYDYERPSIY